MRKHLKAAIFQRDYTQRALARRIGMREDRLSEIVCAATSPREEERAVICAALGAENTEDLWAVTGGSDDAPTLHDVAAKHQPVDRL